ncbi:phage regulatory CII family protein [Parashewanella spongiae]|nr:phage regulatory CII family protein [Parashewanella spongiae]MCL1077117.1 phage regulatory CII family protein [Parashewanella spongiae]
MFASDKYIQCHVDSAYREFAAEENIKEVALAAGFQNPQILRNKLSLKHTHRLTVYELVKIVKASGNRCIIDGILLEVDCQPSQPYQDWQQAESQSFEDCLSQTYVELGTLSAIFSQVKQARGLTIDKRHQMIKRLNVLINEFRQLIQRVEDKCPISPLVEMGSTHSRLKAAS